MPRCATGAVDVAVTVRDPSGVGTSQTFRVNVVPDVVDSPPFLASIPEIVTPVDTPVTHQLVAVDVEGDPAFFLDQSSMVANGLTVPVVANANLRYAVDFNSGLMTTTPTNALTGTHLVAVATAVDTGAVDYQLVRVVIGTPTP